MDSLNFKITRLFNRIKASLSGFYLRALTVIRGIFKFKNNGANNNQQQVDLDKKLVFSLSKSRIPRLKQLKYFKRFLSKKEILLIYLCALVIIASSIFLAGRFYKSHLRIVPVNGGEYTEALIGSLKYVNPLYSAISDVDSDISSLVFSSIFRYNKDSILVNDLADSYEISEDGKVYTIKIRQDVNWHNSEKLEIKKLNVDDIIFTFNCIKDKIYHSPLYYSFTGVKLEKADDRTIKFILTEPYAAFPNLLTFGVIPEELWRQISGDAANLAGWNLKPIGSGPYQFKSFIKDEKTGNIRLYNLVRNEDYYGDKPYISKLSFKFFPGFEEAVIALNEGAINGISYLPAQIKSNIAAQDSFNYYKLHLPHMFAIFFNQENNKALKDKKIRQALAMAIDKDRIIKEILNNEAYLIDGPILPNNFAYNSEIKKYNYNNEEAGRLLDEAGWKVIELSEDDIIQAEQDVLSEDEKIKSQAEKNIEIGFGKWRVKNDKFLIIQLTTINDEESVKIAEAIREFWSDVNVNTAVEFIPATQIHNNIIKPRNFTALLYSVVVGSDPDLYPFWHSSQIGEDGLNITDYANKDVDALLEDARLTSDIEIRKEKYKKFQEIIAEEVPAIFLYSPTYTYAQNKKIKGFDVQNILTPSDRFSNISSWYIKTGKKLKFN